MIFNDNGRNQLYDNLVVNDELNSPNIDLINLLKGSEEVTAELSQRKEILDIGTITKIPVTMPMKMEIN